MVMSRVTLSIAALCLLSIAAFADELPAKLECSVDSQPKPVKAKVGTKMGKELHCSIKPKVDKPLAPDTKARAWITYAGQAGAPRKVAADSATTDDSGAIGFQLDGFNRNADFKGCVDFVVHGELAAGPTVRWSGQLAVKTKCDAVHAVRGALTCRYTAQDGTRFKWPGNGAKVKPRLTEATGVVCGFTSNDRKADGLATTWWIGGKRDAAKTGQIRCMEPDCNDEVTFTPGDYDECADFTIEVASADDDGREALHLTQKLSQFCPD